MLQGQRRVAPHLYAGARFAYLDLNTGINREEPLFPDAEIPRLEFESHLAQLGPVLSYDRRDNSMNPRRGRPPRDPCRRN